MVSNTLYLIFVFHSIVMIILATNIVNTHMITHVSLIQDLVFGLYLFIFLYRFWISNILATSITEETCIVEMRIWCKKIGTVNFISLNV